MSLQDISGTPDVITAGAVQEMWNKVSNTREPGPWKLFLYPHQLDHFNEVFGTNLKEGDICPWVCPNPEIVLIRPIPEEDMAA